MLGWFVTLPANICTPLHKWMFPTKKLCGEYFDRSSTLLATTVYLRFYPALVRHGLNEYASFWARWKASCKFPIHDNRIFRHPQRLKHYEWKSVKFSIFWRNGGWPLVVDTVTFHNCQNVNIRLFRFIIKYSSDIQTGRRTDGQKRQTQFWSPYRVCASIAVKMEHDIR